MATGGFRAAAAYVEVTARVDEQATLAGARNLAGKVERELRVGGDRAGASLTDSLTRAGSTAGNGLVSHVEGRLRDGKGRFLAAGERAGTETGTGLTTALEKRLRDSRGRFLGAGEKVSEDVHKGAERESKRSGSRVFLSLIRAAPRAGLDVATGLMGALRQGMEGPAAPYLVGALTAGALVAGPMVGALLAGGITAGLATVTIGAGVAAAMQDPEIKHAATQTGESIKEIFLRSAAPFKPAVVEALGAGEDAIKRWEPLMARAFLAAAPLLRPLVDGLTGLVDRTMPGMVRLIENARPVVDAVANGLRGTGSELGNLFSSISDNGAEMAAGIAAAFFLINSSIHNVTMVINGMAEMLGWAMERWFAFGELLGRIGAAMMGMPGMFGNIGKDLVNVSNTIGEQETKWDSLKNRMTETGYAGQASASGVSQQTQLMSLSMGAAIQQAGSLSAAFQALNGSAMSAREAESAYQAAIDNVTASIKANGKTLDLHTEKGRANDAALRQLVTATAAKAQATYDETLATKGAAQAQYAAGRTYDQGRAQLIKAAMAMGYSRSEARTLANQIMKIPKTWSTKVTLTDMASKKAQDIRTEISKIHGKTVRIDVKYETHGSAQGEHIIGQGTVPKYAMGGEVQGGSGIRDDVPILAMGGEWMIRRDAVRALERAYGPGIMRALNFADKGAGFHPSTPAVVGYDPAVLSIGGAARDLGPTDPRKLPASHVTYSFAPGSITLDASRMRSVSDLVSMLESLPRAARMMGAS